jgi:hypothetical protein
MRRAFAWLSGLVGVAALARIVRRRRLARERAWPTADPASELRETLARSRSSPGDVETPPQPEPETDSASPEERRAQVHARAQQTIDRMREPPAEQ